MKCIAELEDMNYAVRAGKHGRFLFCLFFISLSAFSSPLSSPLICELLRTSYPTRQTSCPPVPRTHTRTHTPIAHQCTQALHQPPQRNPSFTDGGRKIWWCLLCDVAIKLLHIFSLYFFPLLLTASFFLSLLQCPCSPHTTSFTSFQLPNSSTLI